MSFIGRHPDSGGDPGHDVTGAARQHPAPPNAYRQTTYPQAHPYPQGHPYPWAAPQQTYPPYSSYVRKPRNHLVLGVIAVIGFMPLGIASLIFGARVEGRWAKGDVHGAINDSRLARNFGVAGIVCGVAWWFLSVVVVLIGAISL